MIYCFNPDCSQPKNPDGHRFCQHCGWRLRLGDRYEAVYGVGAGHNSRTFVGRDRGTLVQPQCLIKQFTPSGNTVLEREAAAERFRREVEHLAIASEHPQIPDLFEYFEREIHQLIVQQFLVGPHLDQCLQAKLGPFDSDEVMAFLQDVLPILYYLHQNRIIHRDIKPTNFRQPPHQNHWWLVDLGAIKPLTATRMAQPGTVVGSADYAAPEQLRGEATFASDLYSLGVVCLHLLTGLTPFDLFDSINGCWHWRSIVPDVLPRLAAVLDQMVQPAQRDRPPDVATVMASLGMTIPTPVEAVSVPLQPLTWTAEATWELSRQVIAMAALNSAESLLIMTATDHIEVRSRHQPATLIHSLTADPYLSAIAVHPYERWFVTGTRQGVLTRWQPQDGAWQGQGLTRFARGLSQLLFTPTGDLLIADDQGGIHQWDWSTNGLKWTWHGHATRITSLALSHSGLILASGDTEGRVKLWDRRTGECLRTLSRQQGSITALAWLPGDHVLVTAGWDVTLRWRCPQTGGMWQSAKAQGFYLPVRSLLTHPTEPILITGSQDGQQQCWRFDGKRSPEAAAIAAAAPAPVPILTFCAVVSDRGDAPKVFSLSESGQLKRWSYPV